MNPFVGNSRGEFSVQGSLVNGDYLVCTRTGLSLLFAVAFAANVNAASFTYTYQGLPQSTSYGNLFDYDLDGRMLEGRIAFEADSDANISFGYNNSHSWPQDGVRSIEYSFSMTDGGDDYTISGCLGSLPGCESTGGEDFYDPIGSSGGRRFQFSTNAEGEIYSWDIKGDAYFEGQPYDLPFLQVGLRSAHEASVVTNPDGSVFEIPARDGFDTSEVRVRFSQHGANVLAPGNWDRQGELAPQKHIIALSHGFVPDNGVPDRNYMATLIGTIEERLVREGIDLENVEFVTPIWDEAFVQSPANYIFESLSIPRPSGAELIDILADGVGLFDDAYRGAYNATPHAGQQLADEILSMRERLTAGSVPPTIHLIGHSLGSVVSANAVAALHDEGVTTDLLTILDSPKQASLSVVGDVGLKGSQRQKLASFDAAILFWHLMPEGSVRHVENIYGTQLFDYIDEEQTFLANLAETVDAIEEFNGVDVQPVWTSIVDTLSLNTSLVFGQPIAGAVPCMNGTCSGLEATGRNHATVWEQFYESAIAGESTSPSYSWRTPSIAGAGGSYPDSLAWKPERDLSNLVNQLNAESGLSIRLQLLSISFLNTGNSPVIDRWQRDLGTVIFEESTASAISNSPSGFSAQATLDEIVSVQFTYDVSGATTGILSLTFDADVLWELDLSDPSASLSDTVYLSTLDLYGSGQLAWIYDSSEIGSVATFSDLSFLRVAAVAVPEPASLFSALAGICIAVALCRLR